jgi:hypothetical protein
MTGLRRPSTAALIGLGSLALSGVAAQWLMNEFHNPRKGLEIPAFYVTGAAFVVAVVFCLDAVRLLWGKNDDKLLRRRLSLSFLLYAVGMIGISLVVVPFLRNENDLRAHIIAGAILGGLIGTFLGRPWIGAVAGAAVRPLVEVLLIVEFFLRGGC